LAFAVTSYFKMPGMDFDIRSSPACETKEETQSRKRRRYEDSVSYAQRNLRVNLVWKKHRGDCRITTHYYKADTRKL
jgi:hypothetical protein